MKNAGALAVLAAVGATVVLAACSPSLEEASPLPPGTEPDLTIDAPSSNSVAPAEPTDDACTIEDFTVEGESGTRPKITHPGPPCTAPETVLTAELDAGGGVAAKKGDTVSVNYVIVGVTSGKRVTTWTLAKSEPEPVEAGSGGKGWDAEVVGMRPGGRKLVVLAADELPDAEQQGFEAGEAVAMVLGRPGRTG